MANGGNGKWMFLGLIGATVGIITGASAIIGMPSCAELVTEAEAKVNHDVMRDKIKAVKTSVEAKADSALNATEHREFRQSFTRQSKAIDANQKATNKILWQILREVREVK